MLTTTAKLNLSLDMAQDNSALMMNAEVFASEYFFAYFYFYFYAR